MLKYLLIFLFVFSAYAQDTATPTPTIDNGATVTPTATPEPTPTATPVPPLFTLEQYNAEKAVCDAYTPKVLTSPTLQAYIDVQFSASFLGTCATFINSDRLSDLDKRWQDMSKLDAGMPGFYSIHPNIPNAALWHKQNVIDNADKADAEANLKLVEDAWTIWKNAAAIKKEKEDGIALATKAMDWGKRVVALIGIRTDSKNLNAIQINQINETFAPIVQLLFTGSLQTAYGAIDAVTPDGVLMTQADKDAMLSEIAAFAP